MSDNGNNFYCSQKFTWLGVDLEKKITYSCCEAAPEKINMTWLKQNPGKLFNTPRILQERQSMLQNQPVDSCHTVCWHPESLNLPSRRVEMNTTERTHLNVEVTSPETLNIILGRTCNLTCSYCCKQYSSAWLKDIVDSGPYLDHNRFIVTQQDTVISKLSQAELQNSSGFLQLFDELTKFKNLKLIYITGGEPFLYNGFPELINNITQADNICFYTGLGVNTTRLQSQLDKIKNKSNLLIFVSAENCNQLYEFNRYGITYSKFLDNLNCLLDNGFKVEFAVTLTNLTMGGLAEFHQKFKNTPMVYNFCSDPDFLAVNVLDPDSKMHLIDSIEASNISIKHKLIDRITQPCSDLQKQNLSTYLKEFSDRRKLKLDIFPKSMLQWLNLN